MSRTAARKPDLREDNAALIHVDAETLQEHLRAVLDSAIHDLLQPGETIAGYTVRTPADIIIELHIAAPPGESDQEAYRRESGVNFV